MLFGTKEPDIFEAHSLYVEGKYAKALHAYEAYYAQNSDSLSALRMMSNICFMAKDREKGESLLIKLTDRFLAAGYFYEALSIASKLIIVSSDKPRFYRLAHDIYEKMGRQKLAVRYLFALADMYKSAGKFSECSVLLTEIFRRNADDRRLIIKVLRKLTVLGSYQELSDILADCVESRVLSDFEIDDMVVYLLESGCRADLVMPFLKSFLKRNPDNFEMAEGAITAYFSKDFNADEFNEIIAAAPAEATYGISMEIKEAVADKAVLNHLLYLESLKGDRNRIKGLICEMYLDNALDMRSIEDICVRSGCDIALEEAGKMVASESHAQEKPAVEQTEPVIETFEQTEDISEYEPMKLDSFVADDGAPTVDTAIDIADDFGLTDPVQNSDTSFSGFETFNLADEKHNNDNVFKGFEDIDIDAKNETDYFEGLVEEKKEEKKEKVVSISFDESDLKPSSEKKTDDFFSQEMEG